MYGAISATRLLPAAGERRPRRGAPTDAVSTRRSYLNSNPVRAVTGDGSGQVTPLLSAWERIYQGPRRVHASFLSLSVSSNMSELMRIPQPPPKPIVGNTFELDPKQPIQSLANLLKQYGEIVQLNMMGREVVIVGSRALVHEVCDQKRFEKKVGGALEQVRNLAGDGTPTAGNLSFY